MQSFTKTLATRTAFTVAALGTTALLVAQASSAAPMHVAKVPRAATAAAAPTLPAPRAIGVTAPTPKPTSAESLRARLKYETAHWGGKPVRTLDEASRLLLARAAADSAGLRDVGLGYQDVYGVIEAETSWIQRTGSSKDGTPNLGLAQFEPRTARSLGLTDPSDPVQAVFAAARYMKLGAQWASGRIGHLQPNSALYAAKLREGVSVHYNLSIKGRSKWNGLNTAQLPVETQRHIRNAAAGAKEAIELARNLSA